MSFLGHGLDYSSLRAEFESLYSQQSWSLRQICVQKISLANAAQLVYKELIVSVSFMFGAMPRKKRVRKIPEYQDYAYKSKIVGKMINCIMIDGKKNTACKIFYKALEKAHQKSLKDNPLLHEQDPLSYFEACVRNVQPRVEMKTVRHAGATRQVPREITDQRIGVRYAIGWLRTDLRNAKGVDAISALTNVLQSAYNKTGGARKKCEEVYRVAKSNLAYVSDPSKIAALSDI